MQLFSKNTSGSATSVAPAKPKTVPSTTNQRMTAYAVPNGIVIGFIEAPDQPVQSPFKGIFGTRALIGHPHVG